MEEVIDDAGIDQDRRQHPPQPVDADRQTLFFEAKIERRHQSGSRHQQIVQDDQCFAGRHGAEAEHQFPAAMEGIDGLNSDVLGAAPP